MHVYHFVSLHTIDVNILEERTQSKLVCWNTSQTFELVPALHHGKLTANEAAQDYTRPTVEDKNKNKGKSKDKGKDEEDDSA